MKDDKTLYELSEQEVELVNMLRGFTAEGADVVSCKLTLEFKDERWHIRVDGVDGGAPYVAVGEALTFDEAWALQTQPIFSQPVPANQSIEVADDRVAAAFGEAHGQPVVRAAEVCRLKPRLRVGSNDNDEGDE